MILLPLLAILQTAPSDVEIWGRMIKEGKTAEAVALVQGKAARGDPEALNYLGWLYDTGTGLPKDLAKAAAAYARAAEGGQKYAQWRYGVMLDMGVGGLKQDSAAAFRWFEKSAAQGFTNAMVSKGVMYSNGRGVPLDHVKAIEAYREAVRAGNVAAPAHLGIIYANGEGVAPDLVEASAWFLVGVARGDDDAKKYLEMVQPRLDEGQMKAAADRANAILQELGLARGAST